MNANLEHHEITEQIIGAAYEVYRVLGYGILEKVYQKAMQVELIQRGLNAELEYRTKVYYKEVCGGDYEADIYNGA